MSSRTYDWYDAKKEEIKLKFRLEDLKFDGCVDFHV